MELSPEKIVRVKRSALLMFFFYIFLGVGLFADALFLFMKKGLILAGSVPLMLAFLLFSYGLRELMVYAQLRLQRNRLTLPEFFQFILKGRLQ